MISLPRTCRGGAAVRFLANSYQICCVELALKGLASAGKSLVQGVFPVTDGRLCHADELLNGRNLFPWLPLPA